jgi:hypothetical protein
MMLLSYLGRDTFIKQVYWQMIGAMLSSRFLALIGPLGCGKSSLIHTGLLSLLRNKSFYSELHPLQVTMLSADQPLVTLVDNLQRIVSKTTQSQLGEQFYLQMTHPDQQNSQYY